MDTLKEWMKPEIVWFLVGILLLIAELALPGLVIFFFGIGALLVGTLCLVFDLSLNLQLTLFLAFSLILLFSLRKWLGSIFRGKKSGLSELDDLEAEFVGKKAIVTSQITPELPGKVELNGTLWTAEADEPLAPGTPVEVVHKANLTLKVKPLVKRRKP